MYSQLISTAIILISFAVGAFIGWFLAEKGVTAKNAFLGHQRQVYLTISVILGLGTLFSIVITAGQHSPWMPPLLPSYISGNFWYLILFLCSFSMGLLFLLEKSGWFDRARLQQLILLGMVNCFGIWFLLDQNLPITNLIKSPSVIDGVVLQTTPSSCSAAAIATIARFARPELQTTELDVVKLAGTNRQGTNNILGEIHAMTELGLEPDYKDNLTINDLVNRNQMAILSVMEPIDNIRISHAIGLISINPTQETLTVANPLYGRQIKSFKEMKDYWKNKAIFVNVKAK